MSATIQSPSGLGHVATVSFLASRASPAGGFWIALAGGTALARAAERRGARLGYGVSIAAVLETVAIMGPARFGVPLTQAISAPLLGRLEARGTPLLPQILACAAIRLVHNAATTAFFIWIVTGGLDAYTGSYDAVARRIGIEGGDTFALGLTGAGLLAWAAFASSVQVLVYRRGLRSWGAGGGESAPPVSVPAATATAEANAAAKADADAAAKAELDAAAEAEAQAEREPDTAERRFDPRAVALAAALAFALLLVSTEWLVLGLVAVWLAGAWALSRADSRAVPAGLVIGALLAAGAFAFSLGGGLGLDVALRRATRAALLVAVATWLRSAAGAVGLREVSRRGLGRLRRVPSMPEATRVMEDLSSERRLLDAGRALLARLGPVRKRPLPIVDAVLAWVAAESRVFSPGRSAAQPVLRVAPGDVVLVALAAVPAAAAFGLVG